MWDTELISTITLGSTAIVPIIVALTQMVKVTGWISDKFVPFISIGFGILLAFLLSFEAENWSANILAGILFGLASSGLYSGLKSTAQAYQVEKMEKARQRKKD